MAYLFLLPLLAFYLTFTLWPLLRSVWLSFTDYEFLDPRSGDFVGLANYLEWLKDPAVPETLWIAIQFTLMYVAASTLYAFIVAVLLDRVKSANTATVYRVFFFLPVVLPSAVVYYVWKWMYDASYGVFNHLLIDVLHLPIQPIGWLTDPDVALKSLVMMSTWELMGTTMMLFLVGLNNISNDLYEAAKIDGASEWQSLLHITLPMLKPIFLIIVVMRLRVLGIVVEPLVMTLGDPLRSTMTYGLHAYFTSFQWGNYRIGYGATWFVLLGILSTLLAFAGWKLLGRRPEE